MQRREHTISTSPETLPKRRELVRWLCQVGGPHRRVGRVLGLRSRALMWIRSRVCRLLADKRRQLGRGRTTGREGRARRRGRNSTKSKNPPEKQSPNSVNKHTLYPSIPLLHPPNMTANRAPLAMTVALLFKVFSASSKASVISSNVFSGLMNYLIFKLSWLGSEGDLLWHDQRQGYEAVMAWMHFGCLRDLWCLSEMLEREVCQEIA